MKQACRQVGTKEYKNVIAIPRFNRGIQKKELDSLVKPENDIFGANKRRTI
ncbi:MAG: hypothetical protein WA104_07940 [Thermodesulfovibrionales bacterium]